MKKAIEAARAAKKELLIKERRQAETELEIEKIKKKTFAKLDKIAESILDQFVGVNGITRDGYTLHDRKGVGIAFIKPDHKKISQGDCEDWEEMVYGRFQLMWQINDGSFISPYRGFGCSIGSSCQLSEWELNRFSTEFGKAMGQYI